MALVRDPRLAQVVNDIVVEFGSSLHQEVMDRSVRGASVADTVLRRAWQDTTQPDPVWDVPMYEEFCRAVRGQRPVAAERRMRILLCDPPFDWDTAPTREAW